MSTCYIIAFRDGKPAEAYQYQNAWGGAAWIWDKLYNKYLKNPLLEYDTWLSTISTLGSPLWKLQHRADMPPHQKAVHVCTYDRHIVSAANFARFVSDLRKFVEDFGGEHSHLLAWADLITSGKLDGAEAIGFYHTSVAENLWIKYDEATDQDIPYDLRTGEDHQEVYEYLAECEAETASAD